MHFFGGGGGGCSFFLSFFKIFWKPNFYNNELSINYIKAQAIGFQRKEGELGWGGGGGILLNEALYEQTWYCIKSDDPYYGPGLMMCNFEII